MRRVEGITNYHAYVYTNEQSPPGLVRVWFDRYDSGPLKGDPSDELPGYAATMYAEGPITDEQLWESIAAGSEIDKLEAISLKGISEDRIALKSITHLRVDPSALGPEREEQIASEEAQHLFILADMQQPPVL